MEAVDKIPLSADKNRSNADFIFADIRDLPPNFRRETVFNCIRDAICARCPHKCNLNLQPPKPLRNNFLAIDIVPKSDEGYVEFFPEDCPLTVQGAQIFIFDRELNGAQVVDSSGALVPYPLPATPTEK
ncbi:MAG: hypothetical protein WCO78_00515 [Candidatus Roizmanbacteria bacterium]